MQKPTDYPVDTPIDENSGEQTTEDITLAMLSERVAAKQPVTDQMIQVARTKMDLAHSKTSTTAPNTLTQGKSKISRIRDRFR